MHHCYVRLLRGAFGPTGSTVGALRRPRASRRRSRPDPVRSIALGRIEPQYPRLVVPLRQSLQVSLLRVYSPDGPVAEASLDATRPESPRDWSSGFPGLPRWQRSLPRLQRCLIAFAPEDLAPHRPRDDRRPPGRPALLPGSPNFTPPPTIASTRATLLHRRVPLGRPSAAGAGRASIVRAPETRVPRRTASHSSGLRRSSGVEGCLRGRRSADGRPVALSGLPPGESTSREGLDPDGRRLRRDYGPFGSNNVTFV